MRILAVLVLVATGCGPTSGRSGSDGGGGGAAGSVDMSHAGGSGSGGGGGVSAGGGGAGGGNVDGGDGVVYTVYMHSNTELYSLDVTGKKTVDIGPFNAPNKDVIQDLAVAPNNVIYVISSTNLYTADPNDGHVTLVSAIGSVCGTDSVALTTTPDGKLYAADYYGAVCEIDISSATPKFTEIATAHKGSGWAISGDIVGIGNGDIYGTAYDQDASQTATKTNNVLVRIDPTTGQITQQIGATGFPQLYGVAYANGTVFGFTHDGSGRVITIDPATGVGTLFATFAGVSFAGAGVNSKVPPVITSAPVSTTLQ